MALIQITSNSGLNNIIYQTIKKISIVLTLLNHANSFEKQKSICTTEVMLV
jgi:hypothetical protein